MAQKPMSRLQSLVQQSANRLFMERRHASSTMRHSWVSARSAFEPQVASRASNQSCDELVLVVVLNAHECLCFLEPLGSMTGPVSKMKSCAILGGHAPRPIRHCFLDVRCARSRSDRQRAARGRMGGAANCDDCRHARRSLYRYRTVA